MKQSGLADSPLFKNGERKREVAESHDETPLTDVNIQKPENAVIQPSNESPIKSTRQSTYNEINPSGYHDITGSFMNDTTVDFIRAAVKQLGKEGTTHRFSQAEKRAIGEIVYTFRNRGLRTSENELVRIAVNFLLEDYKVHRDGSMLSRCLDALHR